MQLFTSSCYSHCTPQISTYLSLAEFLYKRKSKTKLKLLLKPKISNKILKQEESKVAFNESKDLRILYPGDQVQVRNYQQGGKWIVRITKNQVLQRTQVSNQKFHWQYTLDHKELDILLFTLRTMKPIGGRCFILIDWASFTYYVLY